MNIRERLREAKHILMTAMTPEETEKGMAVLRLLPAPPVIDEENEALARAYAYKLTLKKLSLEFFRTLDDAARVALVGYIDKCLPDLGDKFPGTRAAFESVRSSAQALSYACTVAEEARRITAQSEDVEELRKAERSAVAARDEVRSFALPAKPLGEGTAFPDPSDCAAKVLDKLADEAGARARRLLCESGEKLIASLTSDLAEGSYDYFPDLSREMRGMAGAIVLCTPLEDEAELFVHSYAVKNKRTFVKVRAEALAARGRESIRALFDALGSVGKDCLVLGAAHAAAAGEELLAVSREFGGSGRMVMLCDDGDVLYRQSGAGAGISRLDLSMPFFRDVNGILISRGMASEEDEEEIKRIMPFAGFTGLNAAVAAHIAGSDWKRVAAMYSDEHAAASLAYLTRLGNPSRFIDSGWGDFSAYRRGADRAKRAFDYDEVRIVDPANVRRIMESGQSLFARIGATVRYCLLAGADKSAWSALDAETRGERINEATRLTFRALGMETVPDVTLEADLGKGVGGLCSDGGRVIKYLESLAANYEFMHECICHESFHAFQHDAIADGWRTWHWTELGVVLSRLDEWKFNFSHYYPDTSSKGYKVEIVECDARSFASECVRQGNECWHELDLE